LQQEGAAWRCPSWYRHALRFRAIFAPSLVCALTGDGDSSGAFADRLENGLKRRLANRPVPLHSFVQTIVLAKQGSVVNVHESHRGCMAEIVSARMTAEIEGDFVVFIIGMRINKRWKLHKWVPVFRALPRMLKETRTAAGQRVSRLRLKRTFIRAVLAVL
jgi:hypothetical protein